MSDYDELKVRLAQPMHVTMQKGCPELDEYDEERLAALAAIRKLEAKLAAVEEGSREARAEGWRAGQEDMRERAAMICREAIYDDPIDSVERFRNRALTGCEVKIRALTIEEAEE